MRILYASHFGGLGGAERSLLELCGAVAVRGIEVGLLCPEGPLQRAAARAGMFVASWSASRLMRAAGVRGVLRVSRGWREASEAIARFRPTAVHANTTQALLWMGAAPRAQGVPVVWHWRDFETRPWLARCLARWSDVAIAISEAMLEHALCILGPARISVALVRNAVADQAPERTPHELRRSLRIPDVARLIAMGGQSIPRKGHDVLVAALSLLSRRHTDVHAVLVCSELDARARTHTRRLRELARRVRNIQIVTNLDGLGGIFAASEVVAVPSRREPFGRVAVEALLAERPVVASDVDGLREIVSHGQTGLLVPPGDPANLAAALEEILDAPETWRARGPRARANALAMYAPARLALEMDAVYRAVASRGVALS